MARRYEFYVRVGVIRKISHSFAALTREILFLPREHKIHIFELTSNFLFMIGMISAYKYYFCYSNVPATETRDLLFPQQMRLWLAH